MPSIHFDDSNTRLNLMRAFAGESQARNRYTFAAQLAADSRLRLVADVFRFTAAQEKEHAEVFYNLLAACAGQTIRLDGGYPVNLSMNVQELLSAARHNETEEAEDVYPAFAAQARAEGFTRAADVFAAIAAVEKTHAERFGRYLRLSENDALFSSGQDTAWLCLNCGHIHTGSEAPALCPVCRHDQGNFIRADLTPFAGL